MQDTEHATLLELSSSDTAFSLLNPGTSEAQFSPATATFSFNNELYADFAGFSNFQSGKVKVHLRLTYAELTSVYVTKTLQFSISDCNSMGISLPT